MLYERGIRFPNLGIAFEDVPRGFTVFGLTIAYYGIIIAAAMIVGVMVTQLQARRTKQNGELYLDFALLAIISSVIGARLFYVVFEFEEFVEDPMLILNIRTGGLAIYGGILTALLAAALYAKLRRIRFGELTDTCVAGLAAGQVIGRLGNFFNRESFGSYTENLFAMQLNIHDVSSDFYGAFADLAAKYADNQPLFQKISEIRDHQKVVEGVVYIQVHPVFLYEMMWNFVLFLLIMVWTKHKKFHGELLLLYLAGYGLGRLWMEELRLDSLYLWGTVIPVARVLSLAMIGISAVIWISVRIRLRRKGGKKNSY